ncbi:MAG: hypothetical protein ACPGWR_15120 [Ardenticatenaceae bacterium]
MYITYKLDGGRAVRHPSHGVGYKDMDVDDVWHTELRLEFKESAWVSLYDKDSTSGDDFLGEHTYHQGDQQPYTQHIHAGDNKGRYEFYTVQG